MIPEQELTDAQFSALKQLVINEFAEKVFELVSPEPPAEDAKPFPEFLAIPDPAPAAFGGGAGGGGIF